MGITAHIEARNLTQERIAENESRFRNENERIEATATRFSFPDPIPFICECPDPACTDIVQLTLEQYEEVREHPRRFFAAPGHQGDAIRTAAGVVIADCESYVVVEKVGVAGEVAETLFDEPED
jgi:hypothetical protein